MGRLSIALPYFLFSCLLPASTDRHAMPFPPWESMPLEPEAKSKLFFPSVAFYCGILSQQQKSNEHRWLVHISTSLGHPCASLDIMSTQVLCPFPPGCVFLQLITEPLHKLQMSALLVFPPALKAPVSLSAAFFAVQSRALHLCLCFCSLRELDLKTP